MSGINARDVRFRLVTLKVMAPANDRPNRVLPNGDHSGLEPETGHFFDCSNW